ncbi:hypothetical protein [Stutzerimonas nitrititolerans]|uniref:hypothetical protein n=1 Tax=Stutzerimonas nitrititolerans TaxID=2482751 RepID=UPI0028AABCB3|nr:hypothetical protein [Stutzerimonas nitrititolerans]
MSNELYADSAQARELDRRMSGRYDEWGNLIRPAHEFCHQYDPKEREARNKAENERKAARIRVAIGQMEDFFQCKRT